MHILCGCCVSEGGRVGCWAATTSLGGCEVTVGLHTDLVEATLVGEDGDVSVIACASYMTRVAVSICACKQELVSELPTHQT